MSEQRFHDFLSALPYRISSDREALLTTDLPDFFRVLGHADSTVFFEYLVDLPRRIVADVAIAEDRSETPQVLIQVKTGRSMIQGAERSWDRLREAYAPFMETEDVLLLLFSPLYVGIARGSLTRLYRLASLTREQSGEIYELLRPAEQTFEPDEETVTARVEVSFEYE
jgi:hypothetical protein